MVRTGTRSLEEVDGAEEDSAAVVMAIVVTVNLITKYSSEETMKDGPIFKLTITKTGHRPYQFKKISDALPVLCTNKMYQGLDEVLRTRRDLVETYIMPLIGTPTCGLPHTMYKLALSTQTTIQIKTLLNVPSVIK